MLTHRVSYKRYIMIGLVFALLIAVVVVSPRIIIRETSLLSALIEYLKAFAHVFAIWIINLIALWYFETKVKGKNNLTKRVILSFIVVLGFSLLTSTFMNVERPMSPLGNHVGPRQPLGVNRALGMKIFGMVTAIAQNTLVLFALEILLLRNTKTNYEAENYKLREEKLEAVNLMLKQQIQPHFLFNSLNTLKSLIRREKGVAEEYLVKLADFLRVSISNQGNSTVPIREELSICANYMDLQGMRFGESLKYNSSISDETIDGGFVPPFSIQLLIENAIKHNQLTDDSPLIIDVSESNGWIIVSNNLQLRSKKEESTGIGLANLKARYESIANEEILIDQTTDKFQVKIKIL